MSFLVIQNANSLQNAVCADLYIEQNSGGACQGVPPIR